MGSGIAIGYYPSVLVIDPIVTDWITRTVAAGGSVANTTRNAMDTYVKSAKTKGYWSVISSGLILPFASDGFPGCFVPLIIPSGGTLTPQNFTASNYALSTGLDPGSTEDGRCIQTNISRNTIHSDTSAQVSAYMRTARNLASTIMTTIEYTGVAGIYTPSNHTALFDWGNEGIWDAFSSPGGRRSQAFTNGRYLTGKRLGSVNSIAFEAVVQSQQTVTESLTNSQDQRLLLFSYALTGVDHLKNIISYLYCGSALSDAQELQHYTDVQALQNALGRAV